MFYILIFDQPDLTKVLQVIELVIQFQAFQWKEKLYYTWNRTLELRAGVGEGGDFRDKFNSFPRRQSELSKQGREGGRPGLRLDPQFLTLNSF